MARNRTGMTPLQLRKEALLLESELNRVALQGQVESIRQRLGWLHRPGELLGGERFGLGAWAPLAGGFLAGSFVQRHPLLRTFVNILKVAGVVYPIVQQLLARDPAPPDAPAGPEAPP